MSKALQTRRNTAELFYGDGDEKNRTYSFDSLFCRFRPSAIRRCFASQRSSRGNAALPKVKAVRCAVGQRGACDAPIFFDLNKPASVPAGSYLIGFENSIYPDIVEVSSGSTTTLNLEKGDRAF